MAGAVLTDELWERADKIPGWFSRDEAELVLSVCESPWLEIGCHKGRSTVILASTGQGVVIDTFQGTPSHPEELGDSLPEFRANTAGLPVKVQVGDFRDRWNIGPVRFLHLDADHSYQATKLAFDLYSPKVAPGGHVAFHDAWGEHGSHKETAWPGAMRFVTELQSNPGWEHVGDARRLALFRRCAT